MRRNPAVVFLLLVVPLLAPGSGRAAYEAEGYVRASVRDADGATRTRESTAQFQEGDRLQTVTVGFRGATNLSGYFACKQEGEPGNERPLGNWTINLGKGEMQGCHGEAVEFLVGYASHLPGGANATDGELEIQTSTVGGLIRVRRGILSALFSDLLGPVYIQSEGSAFIASSNVFEPLMTGSAGQPLASLTMQDSRITGRGISWRGSALVSNTSVEVRSFDLVFGQLLAQCEIGIECRWEVIGFPAPTLRIGNSGLGPHDVDMFGHSLLTDGAVISGPSEFLFSSGDWESRSAIAVYQSRLRLQLGSQLDLTGNFTLGSAAELDVANAGTVADIDGNLNASAAQGLITVSDGAQIIVRGTLTLGPEATLDLQPGGTVYAAAVDIQGDVLENGGVLHVPEPEHALGAVVAIGKLLARARRVAREVEPA